MIKKKQCNVLKLISATPVVVIVVVVDIVIIITIIIRNVICDIVCPVRISERQDLVDLICMSE